jgi:cell wall-associated NlpC family hydrolase
MGVGGASQADPKMTTAQAKARVADLLEQAEVASEQYNAAQEQLQQMQRTASQMQDNVAREQASLNTLVSQMGAVAAAQYRSAGMDQALQLMLSDNPEKYLEQASSLNQLTQQQAATLAQIREQRRQLDQDKKEASEQLAALDQTSKILAQHRDDVQNKLRESQGVLNSLTAPQRAEVDKALSIGTSTSTGPVNVGPVSGRAAKAVQVALAQRGKPYVWAATGPSSFDCSGLMVYAWGAAGVNLPRTSQGQLSAGPHVTLANAQPGDLIIYYSGASHVGMYIGNGQMVHAPHSGSVVQVASATEMPIDAVVHITG